MLLGLLTTNSRPGFLLPDAICHLDLIRLLRGVNAKGCSDPFVPTDNMAHEVPLHDYVQEHIDMRNVRIMSCLNRGRGVDGMALPSDSRSSFL